LTASCASASAPVAARNVLGRVLFGAGGAGGVDRALRAIEFLVGRFGTGDGEDRRAEHDYEAPHQPGSIAGDGVR
jgi:hypothetical protein